MLDLFYQGGALFMGILTIVLISMVAVSIVNGLQIKVGKVVQPELVSRKLSMIRSVGLFALIIGLLGQLIGLFSAFQAIEIGAVNVSPSLLASGFKVSMITTIYGVLIYALSLMIWFAMRTIFSKG